MKKVLVALLMVGLVVGVADAGIVKILKVSGTTGAYMGTKVNLPATGYLCIEDTVLGGPPWVVWTWTQGGVKYFSGPWVQYDQWWSPLTGSGKHTYGLGTIRTDVDALLVPITTSGALWGLIGTSVGVGGIPGSLRGAIDMECGLGAMTAGGANFFGGVQALTVLGAPFTGGGFGSCSAYAYKTVNDAVSTAASIANDLAAELSATYDDDFVAHPNNPTLPQ